MPIRNIFILLSLGFLYCCTNDRTSNMQHWQEVKTVDDLWNTYPNQLHSLFAELDLQQPGLSHINEMLSNGDTVGGAENLLGYFRETDRSWVVTSLELPTDKDALKIANSLRSDTVIRNGKSVKIPVNPDGGWQWKYTGPDMDDEFGYSLNSHSYLPTLFVAFKIKSDKKYVEVFDRLIKDWVIHHPLPEKNDSIYLVLDPSRSLDWRDIGEVEWRTLEAGRRLGATWPQTFYAFQNENSFSPAARLLMLSSIYEQANYLRHYHKSGHNWTTMEMNGLALIGLAFPEFKAADNWAEYALQVMVNEINRQVYPDGVQTEISTKTQWVALRRFESVAENFRKADRQVSESYLHRLEEMYNYLAYSMRPDGHQPLNNDSDREDLRPRILKAANKFDRPDWQWIATNGKTGNLPEASPTVTFPWAGIHIMRNGWDDQAHWTLFDTGPYGTGHQHRDKLHLSIAAFGKDILVDGGRYTHKDYFSFDPAIWRGYFRSSFSHNVILVDGKGQNAGSDRAETALVEHEDFLHHPNYDYALGTFSDGYQEVEGTAIHTRSVLYLRDKYWVVLDHFKTDRSREIQVLWHYAPDNHVTLENNEAVSTNQNGANLRIVPLGEIEWKTEIIEGQEKPFIQGWYSEDYGIKVPNPTLIYSTTIHQSSTFAWILAPAKGNIPTIHAQFQEEEQVVKLSISKSDLNPVSITLPLDGNLSSVNVTF